MLQVEVRIFDIVSPV